MTLKEIFTIHDIHKSPKKNRVNYCHILKKSISILDYMTNKHDKVIIYRLDLSFPSNEFFINENINFDKYVDSITRLCDRHNFSPKYLWIRAYSQTNSKYNYHLFLLFDGHNIMNSEIIIEKSNKLWMKLLKTNITGLIKYSLGDNGIMIDQNSPDYMETIEKCIFNVSYFAKHRTKEIIPSKIRDFGSSRV